MLRGDQHGHKKGFAAGSSTLALTGLVIALWALLPFDPLAILILPFTILSSSHPKTYRVPVYSVIERHKRPLKGEDVG